MSDSIKLKPSPEEFKELIELFQRVFESDRSQVMPSLPELQRLLDQPDFMCAVAIRNGRIIGGITVYLLDQYYVAKPQAYLYDLAVETAFQGQGIGTELLHHVMKRCSELGVETMFVQAESEDDLAVKFYRKFGATEELPCVQFSLKFRP